MARLGSPGHVTGLAGVPARWPGVPDDLPGRVLEARGGGSTTRCSTWWLTCAAIGCRPGWGAGDGPGCRSRSTDERAEVLAFEAATFPDWVTWFERLDSVLVARDLAPLPAHCCSWAATGDHLRAAARDRGGNHRLCRRGASRSGAGVGSAMVARASELLRDEETRVPHRLDRSMAARLARRGGATTQARRRCREEAPLPGTVRPSSSMADRSRPSSTRGGWHGDLPPIRCRPRR